MEDIYRESLAAVSDGARFSVDFATRTLKVGKKTVISNGEYEGSLGVEKKTLNEALEDIEGAYRIYRRSLPTERSEAKKKAYFTALATDDISDSDMFWGVRRDYAQIRLELLVLCYIINGSLKWEDGMGKWFWKSSNEPSLIILKEWVEPSK